MSPIERLSQRAQAFAVLGVSAPVTATDIRKAYRKLAFEKHPDRYPEFADEFARITEAYRYVCENARELGILDAPEPANAAAAPSRMSRPSVQGTEIRFDAATRAELAALLGTEGGDGAHHAASAVYRRGRHLTYFVEGQPARGRNVIAVPTGMLADSRRVLPRLIAFDGRDALSGSVEMPAEFCVRHFPGARSLRIRFSSL